MSGPIWQRMCEKLAAQPVILISFLGRHHHPTQVADTHNDDNDFNLCPS